MHRPTTAIGCASCRWPPSTRRSPSASTAAPQVSSQRLRARSVLLLSERDLKKELQAVNVACTTALRPSANQLACAPHGYSRHTAQLHAESLRALCGQLAELEVKSAGAPLVSIATGEAPAAAEWQHESSSSSSGAGKGEDWELL